MADPTRRFSNRVENYVKYRPTYPPAIIELLREECGLTRDSVVADVGSGTGILSEMFLKQGCRVFGVEPNRKMREAGERLLRAYPNFKSVNASAEETTLDNESAEFITAGQAFHWFDLARARVEFARVLRPGGFVVLIWNERRTGSTPFLRAYENLLLARGTDYQQVMHQNIDETMIRRFFGAGGVRLETFESKQVFDFEGLKGRVLSSSYVPEPGHPNYEPLMRELDAVFDAHQEHGRVSFDYDTKVYYGKLEAGG
ncbi:MAG: class I SAM-dependent methyltransferase [Acidobacteria bacterium]|nr:class I SAM-dependent methyltransferase [Acidobacteriota bacterium]